MRRPDSILGQLGETARCDANFFVSNITTSLLAVLCCHLATENAMKLLFFLPFATSQHWAGFVVFWHHSLLSL